MLNGFTTFLSKTFDRAVKLVGGVFTGNNPIEVLIYLIYTTFMICIRT
jgi:hypothetical protein